MHPPGADTVLVRHGDVNVKSRPVQQRMERRLASNIDALLADRGIEGDVERLWTRPLVRTDEERVEAAAEAAADAFGVVSASPARSVTPELPAITDALAETAAACYDGGTFAVDARRADKSLPFTSEDVGREGGQAVWDAVAGEFEPAVDLDDPDLTLAVEVRESEAFVFTGSESGPGGLPLGSQAPLVALVSGGIDSPVAAYEAMKRGSPVVPVYLDLGEYGGPDHEARAVETVRTLSRYAPGVDLAVRRVPAGDAVDLLVREMDRGRMLSYRRFMYRVAECVAEREGARGIVTGEAIGQKSSQTASNLAVTTAAVDLPVHRPLLSLDKAEIERRARAVGTYDDSTIPAGCYRIAPDQVATAADQGALLADEPDGLFEMAADAAAAVERIEP